MEILLLQSNFFVQWRHRALLRSFFENDDRYRKRKRIDSVFAYHEIMSFHPEDAKHLTPEIFHDLCAAYVRERAPDSIALAVAHYDEHPHIHLVISGIEYRDGKASRITKKVFGDIKLKMQEIVRERYPQILFSFPEHGKERGTKGKSVSLLKQPDIALLQPIIEETLKESKNLDDFSNQLTEAGCKVYSRMGKPAGVIYEASKYSFKTLGFELNLREAQNREIL